MKSRTVFTSIRHKLLAGVLMTTITALTILAAIFIAYDIDDYRSRATEELITQADVIGLNSIAALEFGDRKAADQTLDSMRLRPGIRAAALYDAEGQIFARYHTSADYLDAIPATAERNSLTIGNREIALFRPVISDAETLGSVFLLADDGVSERAQRIILTFAGIGLLALAASTVLAFWFQSRVTRPVLEITELARQVVNERNYDLRAHKTTNDEIGYLIDAFNEMLSQIGLRASALEQSYRELAQQIAERSAAELALSDSEYRYRTLTTALSSVVWRANSQGEFVNTQSSWDNFTGQSPDQHAGHGWLEAFFPDDRSKLTQVWAQAREEGVPFKRAYRLWYEPEQQYRYVNLSAAPLLDSDGRPREWMGTIDDIHDRMQALDEVKRLNAELEQRVQERTADLESANQELESFSYSVSHDLRAPLRAIDGFSQALVEDYGSQLDAVATDYLNRVRNGAQRMGSLIDDMLNLSRVSRMELSFKPLNMSEIASDILAELQQSDPERQVTLKVAPNILAYGDPRLIRVALVNLLNNAWKYTGKQADPQIEFGMQETPGHTCYFVRDNGAGFDMAYASRLFTAFQRLHDNAEFSGTGVGLATVQRVIRRHGGRIWAEAEVDKGATFYFTLSQSEETSDE